MPTVELVPDANTLSDDWSDGGFSNLANSSNTTVASNRTDLGFTDGLRYSFGNLAGNARIVDSVYSRWRRGSETGTNAGNYFIYLSGSTTNVELAVTATGTTMTGYFGPLARPGGGSWTVADVNSLQSASTADKPSTVGGKTFFVYYYGLQVIYRVPSGGFAFLIGSLAGAALGLNEMAALARTVYRKTGTLIRPDEYSEAWRDVRDYRHPKFLTA